MEQKPLTVQQQHHIHSTRFKKTREEKDKLKEMKAAWKKNNPTKKAQ